jgi:ribosomal-protein-alanine N-acetyltransferase
MNKKILSTNRLHLCEFSNEDINELYSITSNSEVMKYFPKILSPDETKEMLNKIIKQYSYNRFSFWKVIEQSSNLFIGICGLIKQNIDGIDQVEIGYRINNKFWNKGYATEAANGCKKYANEELNIKKIILIILPYNTPSIAVAKKLGAIYKKNVMFHDKEHNLYEIQ